MFTRNWKVQEKINKAVKEAMDAMQERFQAQIDGMRERHAEHVEFLTDRVAQLNHQLSMANLFVAGNGSLDEQVKELDEQHQAKISTAEDLRALAYKMLDAAEDVDGEAAFIGQLANVGRQMLANRVEVTKTEMDPAVAAALATYENVDENEEEENES